MLLATLFQLVGLAASPVTKEYLVLDSVHSEFIRKYLDASASEIPKNYVDVEVTINAAAPGLDKRATLRALRTTSSTGTVTYTTLDACGDSMLRREVIGRFLSAESDTRKMAELAITPFNYRFHPNGFREEQARRVYVFQLAPKKKKVGLFKGELWVDGQTGLPVHEAGQLIKSPSVFIKRISFTRDYALRDGFDVPMHIHAIVESRIMGRVELDITYADTIPTEVNRDAE